MQLRKVNRWTEDEMALAASQNSAKNQNKVHIKENPQGLKEDVTTVVSMDIRKLIVGNG